MGRNNARRTYEARTLYSPEHDPMIEMPDALVSTREAAAS